MKKRFLSVIMAIAMLLSVQLVAGAATWTSIPSRDAFSCNYSVTNSTGSYVIGDNTIYTYTGGSGSGFTSIPYNSNFTGKKVFGGEDAGFYYLNGTNIYKATYSATTSSWTDTLYTSFNGPFSGSSYYSYSTMYYSNTQGLIICFGSYTFKYKNGTFTTYTGSTSVVTNDNCKLMYVSSGTTNTGLYLYSGSKLYYFNSNNVWAQVYAWNGPTGTYGATANSTVCDGTNIYMIGGKSIIPGTAVVYSTSIRKYSPSTGTTSTCTTTLPTNEGSYGATCFFNSSNYLTVLGGEKVSTGYFGHILNGTLY